MRRQVLLTVGVAVWALLASACTPRSEASLPTSSEPATSTTVSGSPTQQKIAELVGPDVLAVYEAVDEARFDFVVGCMRRDGWEFDRTMLPSVGEPIVGGPLVAAGPENAVRMVEALEAHRTGQANTGSSAPAGADRASLDERNRAIGECFDRALAEVPNPIEEFQQWLATEQSALEDLVRSDERVIEAIDRERRCFSSSGYDFRTAGDANQYFDELVEPILQAYGSGEIDAETALIRLEPIVAEADDVAAVLNPCVEERLATEFTVRSEYELEWLDENADRVALAATELIGSLDGIEDFLPEPPP